MVLIEIWFSCTVMPFRLVMLLPCWRSLLPPSVELGLALEAGGNRFLQNVSNYIPVTQQHHIIGDLNLGPIFCWISPTYLLCDFALQDWPTVHPCCFFYWFAWVLPGLQDSYHFVPCVTVLMVETAGSCKMLIKSLHNPQQHITEYLQFLCKSFGC